jgi:toxin-antitoxin system PIN domain toxin
MKLVDLNILIYAVNEAAHHHRIVRRWWESALTDEEPIGLAWTVLLGFLRLATNPRTFSKPLGVEDALRRLDSWLSHPNTKLVLETDEHWRVLRGLLQATGTAGNLTGDAHLAALALEHGATLVSCDTDFARFPHLRWENPVGSSSK